MKIAVTYQNGEIFRHFGNCENFKFYTISDDKVVNTELININPKGQKHVAEFLGSQQITHLLCGGLGSEARETLESLGIKYYPKVKLTPDEAVDAFLSNTLEYSFERGCCGQKKNTDAGSCGTCKKHSAD